MSDTNEPTGQILIVEDDRSLAHWMADYLGTHGYQASIATRGDTALELIEQDRPDLVVLDLNLPVIDGLHVCEQTRARFDTPILMLTARDEENDEITGLSHGADDYLTKPVRPRLLLARIQALLRRAHAEPGIKVIDIGSLSVDPDSRTARLNGEPAPLSTQEFELLLLLVRHAGQPLSRERLVAELRGIDYDGFDRSIDINISRLRRKFGDDANAPRRIKTLRGIGYLLAPDAW